MLVFAVVNRKGERMSNKAYFYQIDKNREQLEAFMDWVDYSNPAWSYFNYAFYSEKSPKGFYKKQNQITIAFTMDSSDFENFPFPNDDEVIRLDNLRGCPIHTDPIKWIVKNGIFFNDLEKVFEFIDS